MTFVLQAMWSFCLYARSASIVTIAGYLEAILLPLSTWIALLSPCSYHLACYVRPRALTLFLSPQLEEKNMKTVSCPKCPKLKVWDFMIWNCPVLLHRMGSVILRLILLTTHYVIFDVYQHLDFMPCMRDSIC